MMLARQIDEREDQNSTDASFQAHFQMTILFGEMVAMEKENFIIAVLPEDLLNGDDGPDHVVPCAALDHERDCASSRARQSLGMNVCTIAKFFGRATDFCRDI